jgi:hypothetical protein
MKMHFILLFFSLLLCCQNEQSDISAKKTIANNIIEIEQEINPIQNPTNFYEKLSNAAISIIDPEVIYTPAYVSIKYPNGDVPAKTGVCTDVIIRAYRQLGIDLQKEVHEDMKANFSKYHNLKKWGLKTTDKNIDHRRVPNLEVFFERKGEKLPITDNTDDYKTGEIVSWLLTGDAIPHIGIITHVKSKDGKRPMIVHNIGSGQVLEDCLLNWKIIGHFRYGEK